MYIEQDLVRIAKRENNTKRNYLVVDPLQGKHIPVSPGKALKLFENLADVLRGKYQGERLLLVGFAETATAIGAQAALSLQTKYIQTTREIIPGAEYLFFSEEHSHAAEQKLVKDDIDAAVKDTDRILFIEDEVTTGKTILNIIAIMEKLYPGKLKYSVASLLNGMAKEHQHIYAQKGIDLHYLVKTDHSTYGEKAELFTGNGTYFACCTDRVDRFDMISVPGRMDTRRLIEAAEYEKACEELWKTLIGYTGKIENKNILVIGTEEFMYPALFVGKKLEEMGNTVKSHATTRSPIAVSPEEDYPLHVRYELKSLYDSERRTFLYDIDSYDQVLILTDAHMEKEEGLHSLLNAVRTKNENIVLVRWY